MESSATNLMTEQRECGERGHDESWSNIKHVLVISIIFIAAKKPFEFEFLLSVCVSVDKVDISPENYPNTYHIIISKSLLRSK